MLGSTLGSRYEVTLGVTDRVVLELRDDGIGLELPLTTPGLGLVNLRDRAEKLGGTFEIHPREGGGTRLGLGRYPRVTI